MSSNFSIYLQRHRKRLDYTFSIDEIENIGRHHKDLCGLYRQQPDAKRSIDSFDKGAAYRDAWKGLQNTYPLLERFVGSLATIFPSTSTVESNFSVVKYEKTRNRMCLSDASFKGILHAKQYRRMRRLGSESSLNTVWIKIHNNVIITPNIISEYCLNKNR